MPPMCQCQGDCGYSLCCRKHGRRRKGASGEHRQYCADCRGEAGRDRSRSLPRPRRRPAAALRRPAAAGGGAGGPGVGAGGREREVAALERIADYLSELLRRVPAGVQADREGPEQQAGISELIPHSTRERCQAHYRVLGGSVNIFCPKGLRNLFFIFRRLRPARSISHRSLSGYRRF